VSQVNLRLVGLEKFYGPMHALDGFSLEVEAGELVVLLGPSGCGKTTALRAVAGLERLDGGQVFVGGADITNQPAAKRNMGIVFQHYSLFPHMTAGENIEFGLKIRKVNAATRRRRSGELLELVGLADLGGRFPHQLSGGQQQRVALARALAIEPSVLLLDEPLSALDAKVRVSLRDEIRRVQREVGIATIFVTHDQEEALAIADRIGVMHQGKLAQLGSPAQIYTAPATEFVAEFVGKVNRLRGVATNETTVLTKGFGAYSVGEPVVVGGEYEVLVRPEQLGVRPVAEGTSRLIEMSFLGSSFSAVVQGSDGARAIVAVSPEESIGFRVGEPVEIYQRGPTLMTLSTPTGLQEQAAPEFAELD
jgi:putative spermidine/putrescine transport system ATP-binding protein